MPDDDLYVGPTALEPEPLVRGQRIAQLMLVPLLALFVAVIAIFYVFFSATNVVGDSMLPNYRPGDRLLISKGYDSPRRGDVVVFWTVDRFNRPEELIKRVIAIPGDTIEVRGDVAIVNGAEEPDYHVLRIPEDNTYDPPHTVAAGEVYVLGDNRPIALDSREIGSIKLDMVRGRAVFRWAPITRMGRAR